MAKQKLVFCGANAPSMLNFRGDLLCELAEEHEVTVVTAEYTTEILAKFEDFGVSVCEVPMRRATVTILGDVRLLLSFVRLFRVVQPDIVINYNAKPMIYGTIAAWLAGCRRSICVVTGLGYAFSGNTLRQRLIKSVQTAMYGLAFSFANRVAFQNRDDWRWFCRAGLVDAGKSSVVGGSGVNMDQFPFDPVAKGAGPVRFLMVSRLLKEKGIEEFMEAASIVAGQFPGEAEFVHVGGEDVNPGCLRLDDLQAGSQAVKFVGEQSAIGSYIKACHYFVLPSYREGIPHSSLEALATGRPLITTDVPGCRDTVRDGENGWLVPARDSESLAQAMISALSVNHDQIRKMGEASYALALEKFDVRKVNRQMIDIIGAV